MKKYIKIQGMSCEHCVKRVSDGIKRLDEVKNISIDLEKGEAVVNLDRDISNDKLRGVIEDLGYDVIEIK